VNTRRIVGLGLLLGGLMIILGGIFLINAWLSSPLPLDERVTLHIERGMTGRDIARKLHREGIITSERSFRWALWFKGAERDLRGGSVRLGPPLSLNDLIDELQQKRPPLVRVQIQEGRPSWRIFSKLSRKLGISQDAFRKLFRNESFIRTLGLETDSLEGYLFPDTYYISMDAGSRAVLRQIVGRFREIKRKNRLEAKARKRNMSLHEAVTLASIIEREARIERERPLISAVYHNRLNQGIPLQADPTLLYPVRNFDAPITHSMLNDQNPYNTYKQEGLPPSPISNPGEGSLRASVEPADVPYLFFVSRGDGTHVFSETLENHQRAVNKFQR
jgi:UPF0755 protein